MILKYPRFSTNNFGDYKKIGEFIIDKSNSLGKGTFGEVYVCWREQDRFVKYACKIIPIEKLNEDQLKQLLDEGRLLMMAQGNYIVPMISFVRSPKNIYYILQYCNQGNLTQYLNRNKEKVNEPYILNIFKMICVGYYEYIFSKNLIHRDIKPENILIHSGVALIADFGFAKYLDDNEVSIEQTYKCTPMYASPQVYIMEEHCKYSYKTDIYSLGVMLYQMIYGYVPGKPNTREDVINYMKNLNKYGTQWIEFPQKHTFSVSYETKQAIKSMMEYKEENRISIDELLNHKMFKIIEMEDNNKYEENDVISKSIQVGLQDLKKRCIQVTKIQSFHPQNKLVNETTYQEKENMINEIDQYFLFIRNVAVFSKITLSNLYHVYKEFENLGVQEIHLDYILILLVLHYKLALQFSQQKIQEENPLQMPSNPNYKSSNQYLYTQGIIQEELKEAEKQCQFLKDQIQVKIQSYQIFYQNNYYFQAQIQELQRLITENQNLNSVIENYRSYMAQYFITRFNGILNNITPDLMIHKTFLQTMLSLCLIHSDSLSINQYKTMKFNEFYQQFTLPNDFIKNLILQKLKQLQQKPQFYKNKTFS